jgi:uncharacterized membrane protein
LVAAGAALVGIALTAIGLRFWLDPERARAFFGLRDPAAIPALHAVVAARDIWLGLLAVALAALKEWRALVVWLALGALVCVADAAIVYGAAGPRRSIAFHLGSGIFCAVLALLCRRRLRRTRPG